MPKEYTIEEKQKYIDYLKELIHQVNYKNKLNSKKNKPLRDFIHNTVPELKDSFYTIQTKIYWLLNDLHEFPKCQNENCFHVFDKVNIVPKIGYQKYCSAKCANKSLKKKELTKKSIIEKYGDLEKFYKAKSNSISKSYWNKTSDERKAISEKRKDTCLKRFGKTTNLATNETKEQLKKISLERYGVENPTQNLDVQRQIQKTKLKRYGNRFYVNPDKAKQTCLKKYGVEYYLQTDEFKEKVKETNLERYGVENGGASEIAHKKMARKYFFDGITFVSSAELAYYIWLKDHDIEFEYQPHYLEYFDFKGNRHRYYPDFKVNGELIEIKGDHLMNDNGDLVFPFKKELSKEFIDERQRILEAKQKCMEDSRVKVIRFSECEEYFDYIDSKYGHDYLNTFRKKAIDNKV